MRLMGQSILGFINYLQETNHYFNSPPVVLCGHVCGKTNLQIPSKFHPELDTRPSYILPHLPVKFSVSNSNTSVSNCDVKKECKNPLNNFVSNALVTSTGTEKVVVTTCARSSSILPSWVLRTSYRMTCVSVDPLMKGILEHMPPNKVQEVIDSPLYSFPNEPSMFSIEYGYKNRDYFNEDASHDNLDDDNDVSLDYDQNDFNNSIMVESLYKSNRKIATNQVKGGASDEQWAAALQVLFVLQLIFMLNANLFYLFN